MNLCTDAYRSTAIDGAGASAGRLLQARLQLLVLALTLAALLPLAAGFAGGVRAPRFLHPYAQFQVQHQHQHASGQSSCSQLHADYRYGDAGRQAQLSGQGQPSASVSGSGSGDLTPKLNGQYQGRPRPSKHATTSRERARNLDRVLLLFRDSGDTADGGVDCGDRRDSVGSRDGREGSQQGNAAAGVEGGQDGGAKVDRNRYPTLTDINHAIITAGRLGRVTEAMEIFTQMPCLGYTPDLMSYNNILWCTGNAKRVEESKRIFQALAKHPYLKPNVYTYGSLMHGFARSKSFKQALFYLDDMTARGVLPNQVVVSSAMEACAEAGKHREALSVMERMTALGLKPDVTMINTAIKACSLAGAMEEADLLAASLREYGSMDLHTYHTLMMGNTKLGRHQRVLVLYFEALDSSARLDGGIYSLAMLGALNCQLFQQVPRIADKARAGGVQLTEASYTILIQAYAELGGIDQAVQCLDLMQSEGLRPNAITYAAAMAACRDRPAAVVELLARMQAEAVVPNTIVLTSAINALARGGGEYTDRAYALMLDMEQHGPEPNIYTYNSIIRAFAEAGRLPEAMSTLRSIELRGLKPDRYTFTTLLMACGRTNSSEPVEAIMETMKMAGIVPDEIAYGAAMDAHRRAGNSLKAVACLNEMRRYNLQPSAAHYNLVIRTLRAEGYVDKMFRMVMTMSLKEGVRVNGNTFELVIEALLETCKWKESLQLIRAMDKLEFRPSLQVCVQLVEVLEQAREYKAVLAMYKYMERQGYDFYENAILNGVFKRLVKVASLGARADLRKAAPLDSFLTEDLLGLGHSLGEKLDGKGDFPLIVNQARPKGNSVQN